jgi:hypothetical protein
MRHNYKNLKSVYSVTASEKIQARFTESQSRTNVIRLPLQLTHSLTHSLALREDLEDQHN